MTLKLSEFGLVQTRKPLGCVLSLDMGHVGVTGLRNILGAARKTFANLSEVTTYNTKFYQKKIQRLEQNDIFFNVSRSQLKYIISELSR